MVCTFTSYRPSLFGPSWYQIRSRKCHVYCCSSFIILYSDLTQMVLFALSVFTNTAKLDPIWYRTEPALDLKIRDLLVLKVRLYVHHRLKNDCWDCARYIIAQ